jgi:tRNA uridine 5-carbamoylmethylation protein Kti12
MATATSITHCVIVTCRKGKVAYKCEGCSQYFCIIHLPDHHQAFGKELDKTEEKINLFRETLIKQTTDPQKHSLIQQINQWENDSINKIRQTAEEARQVLLEHIGEHMNEIEIELTKLTEELKQIREENDFNEIDLNKFEPELKKLEEQLNNPSNISIQQDSSAFINKISVIIHAGKCIHRI